MIGKKFKKTSTLVVTDFNEETGAVKGINDCGAEVIMTSKQISEIYTELDLEYPSGGDL